MSLDKAIMHKKEHRKEYTGAKWWAKSCRNHGDCPWCQGNRKYRYNKRKESCKQQEEEYERGDT
jgi:hypothetical protein